MGEEGRVDNVILLRLYLELPCIGLVSDRLVRATFLGK